jgi:hypothetical protein
VRLQNELGQVKVAVLQNGGKPLKHKRFQSNCKGFRAKQTYIGQADEIGAIY